MTARRFELHRDADVTGVSGTGVVAEGIAFTDGTVSKYERCDVCGAFDRPTRHYADTKGRDRVACSDEHACARQYGRLTHDQRLEVQDYRHSRRDDRTPR